jgi:hypothetical protein
LVLPEQPAEFVSTRRHAAVLSKRAEQEIGLAFRVGKRQQELDRSLALGYGEGKSLIQR